MNLNLKHSDEWSPEEAGKLVLWMVNESNNNATTAAEMLGVSPSTMSRLFAGTYNANADSLLMAIEGYRRRNERRGGLQIAETEVARNIWEKMDRIRDAGGMGLITGRARTGKTTAMQAWIGRNHSRALKVYYIYCPEDKSMKTLLQWICRAMGLDDRGTRSQLGQRILGACDRRTMLVFDEAAHLLRMGDPTEPLEFIRRLHDLNDTAIVICATDWFHNEIENGRLSVYFEQLVGRLEDQIRIPANVSLADTIAILNNYAPNPDKALIKLARQVVAGHGRLASLARHLADAKLLAEADGRAAVSVDDMRAAMDVRENKGIWTEEE